jgi:hypothetical protein
MTRRTTPFAHVDPTSRLELPLRMLFQPTGLGTLLRACEADSFRGLVAAILDNPDYELADPETRLVHRLRLADDLALIAEADGRRLRIADRNGAETINVASDEPLIRSLDRLGFVSLDPTIGWQSSAIIPAPTPVRAFDRAGVDPLRTSSGTKGSRSMASANFYAVTSEELE